MTNFTEYCRINGPGPHDCERCDLTMDEAHCYEVHTGWHCGCCVEAIPLGLSESEMWEAHDRSRARGAA